MTTDPHIEAARLDRDPSVAGKNNRAWFVAGAEWQAAQKPTDAEVAALIDSLAEQAGVFIMPLTASMALQDARRAARRDEEKR